MYVLIMVVHFFVAFILIAVILLQAGRGGGFAEMFGGAAQNALGTRASAFLTKATTICAVIFIFTSLTMAVLSARKGRSLMETQRVAIPIPPPSTEATGTAESTEKTTEVTEGTEAAKSAEQPAAPEPAAPETAPIP